MNEIGGYFSLELRNGKEFHSEALALNSGRNALELILRYRKYNKVWLPSYYCNEILQAFYITETDFGFYTIDKNFIPCIEFPIEENEAVLVINYFGLISKQIKKIVSKYKNIIVDNSQAFFVKPFSNEDTFYSCRKFFGVSDGAYLYTFLDFDSNRFPIDDSAYRLSHLVGRIETGAESSFHYYRRNESSMAYQSIKRMSLLTKAIMKNIDYDDCERKRTSNFFYLHNKLKSHNELNLSSTEINGPFMYPFLIKDEKLRKKLIDNKIFVPLFWNNVLGLEDGSWNYYLAKYLLPLPIDQRYDEEDMDRILEVILK
jgi:hypothetical protein